jgi:hypothetical protein
LWETKWKQRKTNNFIDLWKYGSILGIQKYLIKILLQFLKEGSHINHQHFSLHLCHATWSTNRAMAWIRWQKNVIPSKDS